MPDYQYINTTGVVIADTSDTLATVEAEYRDALGQELITDPATPQGRLIATETTSRDSMLRNNAALANQINPNISGGVFLDAIWALTGGERRQATQSVLLAVNLSGTPTTPIPAGTQARTSSGDLWATLSTVTLDAAGVAVVDFASVAFGPIPAAVGALNTPVSGVLGWETVNNPTSAVVGRNEESDPTSRQRRKNTLSLQNVALPAAITSALYDTDGVRSLVFRENYTSAPKVVDGVLLPPHCVYTVIDGGADADIALALLENKSLGCDWFGAVTVPVVDAASGQTYDVSFDRPVLVPFKVRATIKVQGAVSDPAEAVRDAVMAYAQNNADVLNPDGLLIGETGIIVGQSVSPFELAGSVNRTVPAVYVQKMEVALTAGVFAVAELPITIQQLATLLRGDISVVLA